MSRPGPEILIEQELGNGQLWQILAAETVYVVTYRGQPFNLRVQFGIDNNFKYKKVAYTNLGSAMRQAALLNHRFGCDDFGVVEIQQ